ncbi:hypothetical protein AMPC_04270 [Anaeromyxobacter paludicola]|uniref:Transporter n=2 Tax=Anaeromyxobacter paludicola TaxID=2918171 RepID=A0ABN6N275_9BACT|nr:hypothetical protein AMPC_04270 [Anaeromyxobacter paludicola]
MPSRSCPRLALLALAATLALASPPAARACSVCGCGDPQLDASDPAAASGRFRLQLASEYLSMDAGTEGAPGSTDHLKQVSLRADAVWSPAEWLSLLARVPYVRKDLTTTGPGAQGPGSSLSGLGDAELGARITLLSRVDLGRGRSHGLALTGGASLPTGSNDARRGGERLDEHGQLGTGSFGPYAGLHYAFSQGDWYAFASVTGRFHTVNGFGYQYGEALLWTAEAQYRLGQRVAVSLGLDGREAWADLDHGLAVESTGGLVLAASPAAYLSVGGGMWLGVRAQLPFYARLRGEQSVGPVLVGGVQYQAL